ncbi:MAG: PIN domain-containing protein [Nitrospirae bacterium]|nr:PIN domain-containing protein [Nitrospirota bacterium]
MFLLDTNIIIAYFKGNQTVKNKILSHIEEIAVSTIVIAELNYGAKASQNPQRNLEKLSRFTEVIRIIPFDLSCATKFGDIKSKLRVMGKPTGEVDALIAATAITHSAILVTNNLKHFENIEGLELNNWIG